MHDSIRHRLLGGWARIVSRHPLYVLGVALVLAVLSILVTYPGLQIGSLRLGPLAFHSNRNDLISRKLEWNQRFIDWQSNFPGTNDMIVVVDAGAEGTKLSPQRVAEVKQTMRDLAEGLKAAPHIVKVVSGFRQKEFNPKAIRMASMAEFRQRLEQVKQSKPILDNPTLSDLINPLQAQTSAKQPTTKPAGAPDPAVEQLRQFQSLVTMIGGALEAPDKHKIDLASLDPAAAEDWQFLVSRNGRMYFIKVTPRVQSDTINAFEAPIASVRSVIAAVKQTHPSLDIGMTGIEVVEADETTAASWDSTVSSIIAVICITAVLMLAYHSWRTPVLMMLGLLFGIAWAFGFATIAIGYLQVISVVFTIMLLSLGIAYGIYISARFELVRHEHPDTIEGFEQSLVDTMQTIGPGIITGSITTIASFVTTIFTDFKGVAEMGEIAGMGILLCLIAMFSTYPALLRLFRPGLRHVTPMASRRFHFFEERWVEPFIRFPRTTVTVSLVLAVSSLLTLTRMHFDYDLVNLLPMGIDSTTWMNRISQDGGESIYYGVSVISGPTEEAKLAEVRRRAAAFRALPTVSDVGGIGLLMPKDDEQKKALLEPVRAELGPAIEKALAAPTTQPANGPDVLARLTAVQQLLKFGAASGGKPSPELAAAMKQLDATISHALETGRRLLPAERAERLATLNEQYTASRREVATQIAAVLDPSDIQPADVPAVLLEPYHGVSGPHVGDWSLEIYPRTPPGITPLNPRFLPGFVSDLQGVDRIVTGVVTQIYRSGYLIEQSYFHASIYALIAVFLIVWIDFRSVARALLALLPVAVGFAVTFGVMWSVGMMVNPANIIVLPLMFGVGVDVGVHVVYRSMQDPAGRPLGLTRGTGKGITITSLTTMIGFGSLLIAHHRGIRSLGFVLTAGIGLTWIACLTALPAWLEWRRERGARVKPTPPDGNFQEA